MIPLVEVLTRTETFLRGRGIPSPRYEAELLIAHVLGIERLQIYLQHDRPMQEEELANLRPMVKRRGQREPLAWLLGTTGFHAIELVIRPGVLVPRPDTEALVEATLEWLPEPGETPIYLADVGCGSGAVGLALAHARPDLRVYATDVAEEPLECTRTNIQRMGLEQRVAALKGSLLGPIPPLRPIDWVVSNPPYIATAEIDTCEPEVSSWEPRKALDGGADGLDIYRALIPAARNRARQGLLLEIGVSQAGSVQRLMHEHGFVDIGTVKDLAGRTRVVRGRTPRGA